MIEVVVVEPYPMALRGIEAELHQETDIRIVATAMTGMKALEMIQNHQPDVALMAIETRDMSGVRVLETLRAKGLSTQVIFHTAERTRDIVFEAMMANARGYILQDDKLDYAEVIRTVANGEYIMSSQALEAFVEATHQRMAGKSRTAVLSDREMEILTLTSRGLTFVDIADQMGIAATTVRTYARQAYVKLGVKSKVAAIQEATRRGLIRPS